MDNPVLDPIYKQKSFKVLNFRSSKVTYLSKIFKKKNYIKELDDQLIFVELVLIWNPGFCDKKSCFFEIISRENLIFKVPDSGGLCRRWLKL